MATIRPWIAAAVFLLLVLPCSSRADIHRWNTGDVIQGTASIEPGPGLRLENWNTAPAEPSVR